MGSCAGAVGEIISRIYADRLGRVRYGGGIVSLVEVGGSAPAMSKSIFGVQAQCLSVVRDGGLVVALAVVGESTIVICLRVATFRLRDCVKSEMAM